ncbi:hypothetical protein [Candidatus Symbiopectobacterium endolongispinus]|uniref:hypothetical protein n=1 Tax=Candidatus Symbiopectobacterium endolongispinus TaxID=2812664 RepID=UPI003F68666E
MIQPTTLPLAGPLVHYQQAVATGEYQPDEVQLQTVTALHDIYQALQAREASQTTPCIRWPFYPLAALAGASG